MQHSLFLSDKQRPFLKMLHVLKHCHTDLLLNRTLSDWWQFFCWAIRVRVAALFTTSLLMSHHLSTHALPIHCPYTIHSCILSDLCAVIFSNSKTASVLFFPLIHWFPRKVIHMIFSRLFTSSNPFYVNTQNMHNVGKHMQYRWDMPDLTVAVCNTRGKNIWWSLW